MIDANVSSMKVGDRTVYIRTQLWASAPDMVDDSTGEILGKDWDTALNALRAYGYSEIIETRVSPMTLTSLVRELDQAGDLPEGLRDSLKVSERVKLVVRK